MAALLSRIKPFYFDAYTAPREPTPAGRYFIRCFKIIYQRR